MKMLEEGENSGSKKSKSSHRDSEFYMSHYQKDAMVDRGYVIISCVAADSNYIQSATRLKMALHSKNRPEIKSSLSTETKQ